jgi:geranylgeranyl pyrophosphate synthase
LRQVVATDVELLDEASQHIITAGGKRLRPRLTLLAYLAAGGTDLGRVIRLAAAVELIHTATLVHDDINDHSVTRRGRVTVHEKWGRTFALLTGDYLFTKVYELMAPYGPDYNATMAEASVRLVEGETLQAAAARAGAIDQQTYRKIIARKTASLFEAAAQMGAELGGARPEVVHSLRQYAGNLGMAFQIVDDVLDVIGDPDTLGKPVGLDLDQGSSAVMAQNGRPNPPSGANDPIQEMMARLRESGAVELALAQAAEYADRARLALESVPASEARDELEGLIDLVLVRER